MRSYMAQNIRRVPTYYRDLKEIIEANPGHVIASTACLGSYIGSKLIHWKESRDESEYNLIIKWTNTMRDLFGEDFYLELQPSASEEQTFVNRQLIKIANNLNIKYIITNDAHYLNKSEREIHKAYLNSQDGDREVDSFYAMTYLMDTDELESHLDLTPKELEQAYASILEIKAKCQDFSLLKSLKIPELIWKNYNDNPIAVRNFQCVIPQLEKFYHSEYRGDKVLALAIVDKLMKTESLRTKEVYDAINVCLEMTWESSEVNKAHWSAYYLNLQNIIDTCWAAGSIVGPGRGSGVGFILLYILDIIQINPLWETVKTYPWRFLNPARVSVLDVDFDIEGGRRAQVLSKFREVYGQDRVANVITFGTEKSKQAILTAARGLGIDVDEAQYISSLIPADRGLTRTLKQCYYGDPDNGFSPISSFVQEMKVRPELWDVAQKIEGLVCRIGIHAGGVIFVDEPFTNTTSLMRAPDDTIITAFDLHDCEDVSLIKYDALSVEAEDKIHACIDLLIKDGLIEPEDTLKETYEKVVGVYNLERDDKEMWKMVQEHKILSLFQMEKQSGIQGIELTKPESVEDLAHLNSVIRLMAQEKGAEQPLNKYARFKKNIQLWYNEMTAYGLTSAEQEILKPYVGGSYGIAESQECFMQLVQIPECGGFSLNFADRLRKSIAKKNPKEYEALTREYFETIKEKGLSERLCSYVWNVLVATSRGYGFNLSHTLAYSLVALQEMNLAFKYPIIYWNCACLIVNSGSAENENEDDDSSGGTDYNKVARAIGDIQKAGIKVSLIDINKSNFGFEPDVKNNEILFGLKGLLNVGDEIIETIIKNRPYASPKDFIQKVKPKKSAMISLIKSGAFDKMVDRRFMLAWYIYETCDKKSRINLQNMNGLITNGLLPIENEFESAYKTYEFNRYLKAKCKTPLDTANYYLDQRAINYLTSTGRDNMMTPLSSEFKFPNPQNDGLYFILNAKAWDKIYQSSMDIYRKWMSNNQQDILKSLNQKIFMTDWEKYAKASSPYLESAWEMEVMCFYYHDHELKNVNKKYGYEDFASLSAEPIVDKVFYKKDVPIRLYKLCKICGTCIAKDKAKGNVSLLTTSGVVTVRMPKAYFSLFDKQISVKGPDGKKKIVERSWFNRGSMIVVNGMRRDNDFILKKYATTVGHQLYKIDSIDKEGNIKLRSERYQGEVEDEED